MSFADAVSLQHEAWMLVRAHRFSEAVPYYRKALFILSSLPEVKQDEVLRCRLELAHALRDAKEPDSEVFDSTGPWFTIDLWRLSELYASSDFLRCKALSDRAMAEWKLRRRTLEEAPLSLLRAFLAACLERATSVLERVGRHHHHGGDAKALRAAIEVLWQQAEGQTLPETSLDELIASLDQLFSPQEENQLLRAALSSLAADGNRYDASTATWAIHDVFEQFDNDLVSLVDKTPPLSDGEDSPGYVHEYKWQERMQDLVLAWGEHPGLRNAVKPHIDEPTRFPGEGRG